MTALSEASGLTLDDFAASVRKIGHFAAVVITAKDAIIAASPPTCPQGHTYPWPWHALRPRFDAGKPYLAAIDFRCAWIERGCACYLGRPLVAPLRLAGGEAAALVAWRKAQEQEGITQREALLLAQFTALALAVSRLRKEAEQGRQRELYALQAQINPHFVLNALNTIMMSSRISPHRTRRLLHYLAIFFQHKLTTHEPLVTLREELRFVRAYLLLEKARFGHRLQLYRQVDPRALDCLVPTLSIQPLVENAVKHGLGPKAEGGKVGLVIAVQDASLLITVTDDGVGMPPEDLEAILTPGYGRGHGLGLSNVHRRLQHVFHGNYRLHLASSPGGGTTVSLELPALRRGEEGGVLGGRARAKTDNRLG